MIVRLRINQHIQKSTSTDSAAGSLGGCDCNTLTDVPIILSTPVTSARAGYAESPATNQDAAPERKAEEKASSVCGVET